MNFGEINKSIVSYEENLSWPVTERFDKESYVFIRFLAVIISFLVFQSCKIEIQETEGGKVPKVGNTNTSNDSDDTNDPETDTEDDISDPEKDFPLVYGSWRYSRVANGSSIKIDISKNILSATYNCANNRSFTIQSRILINAEVIEFLESDQGDSGENSGCSMSFVSGDVAPYMATLDKVQLTLIMPEVDAVTSYYMVLVPSDRYREPR